MVRKCTMVFLKRVSSSSRSDGEMISDRMWMMMIDLKFMNEDEHNHSHRT